MFQLPRETIVVWGSWTYYDTRKSLYHHDVIVPPSDYYDDIRNDIRQQ